MERSIVPVRRTDVISLRGSPAADADGEAFRLNR
jgi:hypothetical protein